MNFVYHQLNECVSKEVVSYPFLGNETFQKINPLGLHDLRNKSNKQFYGRWAWCPMMMPRPLINKLHGLSPSGGLVSPSGGFASLFFDQVEYFA